MKSHTKLMHERMLKLRAYCARHRRNYMQWELVDGKLVAQRCDACFPAAAPAEPKAVSHG